LIRKLVAGQTPGSGDKDPKQQKLEKQKADAMEEKKKPREKKEEDKEVGSTDPKKKAEADKKKATQD